MVIAISMKLLAYILNILNIYFYFYISSTILQIHSSLNSPSISPIFLSAVFSPFVPIISWQRVSHYDSVTVGEGWRKTQRDCIVVCSYLIINPHWSVSTRVPQLPLHSAAPTDKVAWWLVAGHGGFVFINNPNQQSDGSYITINHQQWQDILYYSKE